MTGQCAGPMVGTGGGVIEHAVVGCNIDGVEINQVRLGGGVGIVAGGAGGLKFLNMFAVIAPTGRLLAVHHGAAVAFVAERKVRRIVRRAVGQAQLALQQRGIGRAVRAVRAGAAGGGILIAVVAVTAADTTGGGEGRDEAGHAGAFAHAFDGMERGVAGTELQAGIGLGHLAGNLGRTARRAVAVACLLYTSDAADE